MSVTQTRNVDYVLVGKNVNTASISSINDLAEGEIGIFKADGSTGVAAGDSFIVALGGANGKPAYVSEAIKPADVVAIKNRGLEVAKEQSDSIGFNGSAGSIASLTADTIYKVDFLIQEYLTSNTDGRYIKHAQYLSGASAPTQMDVAYNIAKSAILNFSREAEDYMKLDIYSAATGATEAANITVVEGKKTVTAAGTLTAVVGDFIRLGSAGGGATAADTCYKVIAKDGLVYTLDRVVSNGSGTYATATADADVITKAQADAAAAGVKFTGKPLSFVVGKKQYKKVRWVVTAGSEFGVAPVSEETAFEGLGTYEQAAEAEWFARGFEGEYHRMGEPTIHPFSGNADASLAYDVLTIRFKHDAATSLQAGDVSPKQISLYTPNGAGYMAVAKATSNAGVTLGINTIFGSDAKLSHRDTGASADTVGTVDLH